MSKQLFIDCIVFAGKL
ncbi:hypothetical protein Godav_006938 [Gossypium davidsonii]|uniref:Uncharacterized protein n=1 Tax=Gossypium davidsonii TaxID=34287 RepID=A0A7J8S5B5_GOSDV|nr:hypothetical protein [Gossypium davidsonii]